MRSRARLAACSLVLFAAGSGCVGRAVNEGVGLATGPTGLYMQLQPIEVSLDEYASIELERLRDDTAGRVPEDFHESLAEAFADELEKRRLPGTDGATPVLRVRGSVIHIETSALTGLVLGDFEEVMIRAELIDVRSGTVVGRANLLGRSNDSVNRGIGKKAQGAARALAGWIDAHYEGNGDGTVRESLEAKEIGRRDDGSQD